MDRVVIFIGLLVAAGAAYGQNVGIGTVSPQSKLHVVGDIRAEDGHVLIRNTDNTARELRLYEPSGSGANYTAFQAQGQGSDITYLLPASAGAAGQVLQIQSVTGSVATLQWGTPGGSGGPNNAWLLTGNAGTSPWNGTTGNFLGTTDVQKLVIGTMDVGTPQPVEVWVGNQVTLILNAPGTAAPGWSIQRGGGNPRGLHAVDLQSARTATTQVASGTYSVIGGGYQNTSIGWSDVVSGGYQNTASGGISTVGGGGRNTASGQASTVGGGDSNVASGGGSTIGGGGWNTTSGSGSTVGGGNGNTASGSVSTVGGGTANSASGHYSTVSGGYQNTASGSSSTVGGGYENTASGLLSVVVGGYSNTANGSYNLVFGENTDPSVTESHRVYFFGDGSSPGGFANPSGFLVINRLNGDYPIHVGTNGTNGNGAYLSAGGVWTNASSRVKKDRFRPLDAGEVLERIRALPVEGWYYKGTNEYHIGPYAEGFHDAFGTGVLDNPEDARTSLAALDVAGVALLGIQALAERDEAYERRIAALEAENAQLRAAVEGLRAEVQRLREIVVARAEK